MNVFKRLLPFFSLFLVSCAVGPNYQTPKLTFPDTFLEEKTEEDFTLSTLQSWWSSFHDPLLDTLIYEAISHNFDLQIALEKITEARAFYQIKTAELFPIVDLSASERRLRISQTMFDSTFLGPSSQSFYSMGFDASWEVDLFGKKRREKESACYDYQAQIENTRDAYITLLSEIAREYIQIRSLQNQISLRKQGIFIQVENLKLAQTLFESGLESGIKLTDARQSLQQEESLLPPLKEELKKHIFRLSVLIGKTPEHLAKDFTQNGQIPVSEKCVPVGLPSDLLRRRPDIRSAERTLASATANIGVAVAELFPRFSLIGSYGYQTVRASRWLTAQSRNWSIGPDINWPILYFGRLRANIHVQNSKQEQALLNYEQTILQALEDVESALAAYKEEKKRLDALKKEVAAANERYLFERDRYLSGLIDFGILLDADQKRISAEIEQVNSKEMVSINLVSLYKTLGGDWASYH